MSLILLHSLKYQEDTNSMAELLKNVYSTKFIEEIGGEFQEVYSSFPISQFIESVFDSDWGHLELKQRMNRINKLFLIK